VDEDIGGFIAVLTDILKSVTFILECSQSETFSVHGGHMTEGTREEYTLQTALATFRVELCSCQQHAHITLADGGQTPEFACVAHGQEILASYVRSGQIAGLVRDELEQQIFDSPLPPRKVQVGDVMLICGQSNF
jgi:hypothetical protein